MLSSLEFVVLLPENRPGVKEGDGSFYSFKTLAVKTKVLYVFGGEKASGAEIVLERLMNYNLDTVEPHLFISPGTFADRLKATAPYPVVFINRLKKLNRSSSHVASFYLQAFKNYFSISRQVLRYTRLHNIAVVHANNVVPASYLLPAILFSKVRRQKIQWLWSDQDLSYFSKIDNVFSNLCCTSYSTTLAVSEAVKRKHNNAASVRVLYSGLDLSMHRSNEMLRNEFRKQFGFSKDCIVFGIAAAISPRKGQLELAQVFNKLSQSYSNIHLIIAGSFATDAPAYNVAMEHALKGSANITYTGHLDSMTDFYNGCDVIINNSSAAGSEPLGTTIYEAMAFEKIVLASRTGGTPEIIDDADNGFLFTAGSEEALASAITHVIDSFTGLRNIATAARRKVAEQFNIKTMAANYNSIIHSN